MILATVVLLKSVLEAMFLVARPEELRTRNSAIPAANERVQKLQKIREEAISCHHIAMQRMAE
jgi:hypothetical protein